MKKFKKNENGFSPVEIVLVIVILILVCTVGVLVYKNAHKSTPKSSATSSSGSYFDVKDLSIKFIPDKSLSGLSYSLIQNLVGPGEAVYVTDSAVQAAFDKCQADSIGGPIPSSDVTESASFASIARTPGTLDTNEPQEATLIKQFDGFYITINYPNGDICGSQSQADISNWQQVTGAAGKALLTSLKATVTKD